jgi:hypothetical protein
LFTTLSGKSHGKIRVCQETVAAQNADLESYGEGQ